MTRMTPELVLPSPSFHATPTRGRLATTYDLACNRPINGGSSGESGFEPGTLRPQSRDPTTKPPCSSRKAWVEAERISTSESHNYAITTSRHCVMRKDK
ncbi:hypothetical protein AVEN_45968-1 [Araneus ventricosus]|uniref:Uncharacterized protein n=1 Tax=Araneus ventricosus TaxID=182803 RepID=A0A4Y2GAJ5_ARAVE|nr:hypothetical protein AVEN_45968-1 [Araneus ventricosus]